jgi:CheY-like chemotaxis protein
VAPGSQHPDDDSKAGEALAARRRVVLVVEDEVLIRMALAEALRKTGFSVIEACNAAEALDVVEAGLTPDVLLTDVVLPGHMDGLHLAAFLEAWIPGLKVFIASGRVVSTDLRLRLNFLAKPFDPKDAAERVARAVSPFA